MATTNYTMIYRCKNSQNILNVNLFGEKTYKMAEAIATELCRKDGDELIAVVETKKMYPNGKNKKKEETDISDK